MRSSFAIPILVLFAGLLLMGANGESPITFATFLTPTGVVIAAGLLTTLIQAIKTVFPAIDERVSGALMAFVGSAVLYVITALAVGVPTADAGLLVFMAWLSCATSSIGIKAASDHVGLSN